ncbi:MAG: molybdopterin molybdenumtransferase MoeA [Deltaproteobacteria bacterium]|nr:MAG: molybdopterin molybdenumtransferase MoeA [Deltaproteobacteria bacterium]
MNNKDMLGRTGLTSVDDARGVLLENLKGIKCTAEKVALADALGRITASPVISPEALPVWPRSTMDGFAVKSADTFGASQSMPAYLNIVGEVLMGRQPDMMLNNGNCIKIPTGGLLPQGADAVVMHEDTVPVDETMIEVVKSVSQGTAVMQIGEDVQEGRQILAAGTKINPYHLGMLAGLGITEVTVYKRPKIAIISTGDEIVPCGMPLKPGQIRDINAVSLAGLIRQAGGLAVQLGIVPDQGEQFFTAMEQAVRENDMVLFSGGSSVGVRDLGEQTIARLGNPGILVHGVSLKPGKPVIIGLAGKTPVFGLPGHPVSALVCYELFVLPAICAISGLEQQEYKTAVYARLSRNINSAAGRRDVVRVRLEKSAEGLTAVPIISKSGSISSLAEADGYFIIDEDSQGIYQDTNVEVIVFK